MAVKFEPGAKWKKAAVARVAITVQHSLERGKLKKSTKNFRMAGLRARPEPELSGMHSRSGYHILSHRRPLFLGVFS
jgi:hypothetical protein